VAVEGSTTGSGHETEFGGFTQRGENGVSATWAQETDVGQTNFPARPTSGRQEHELRFLRSQQFTLGQSIRAPAARGTPRREKEGSGAATRRATSTVVLALENELLESAVKIEKAHRRNGAPFQNNRAENSARL